MYVPKRQTTRNKSRSQKSVRFSRKNKTCFIESRGHSPLPVTPITTPVTSQILKPNTNINRSKKIVSNKTPSLPPLLQPPPQAPNNKKIIIDEKTLSTCRSNLQHQIKKETYDNPVLVIKNPLTGKDINRFGQTYWSVVYQLFKADHPFVITEKIKYQQSKI
jgi:hypothetical protein